MMIDMKYMMCDGALLVVSGREEGNRTINNVFQYLDYNLTADML